MEVLQVIQVPSIISGFLGTSRLLPSFSSVESVLDTALFNVG